MSNSPFSTGDFFGFIWQFLVFLPRKYFATISDEFWQMSLLVITHGVSLLHASCTVEIVIIEQWSWKVAWFLKEHYCPARNHTTLHDHVLLVTFSTVYWSKISIRDRFEAKLAETHFFIHIAHIPMHMQMITIFFYWALKQFQRSDPLTYINYFLLQVLIPQCGTFYKSGA